MRYGKLMAVMVFIMVSMGISGCRSIYVGGSGKVGDITGGGGVNIPIPEKK